MSEEKEAVRPSALTVVPLLIVVATFVAIVKQVATPVTNTDTYFHLRLGHEFLYRLVPRATRAA